MKNHKLSLLFCIISLFACAQPASVAAMQEGGGQGREDVNADVALLQLPDEVLETIVLFSLEVRCFCCESPYYKKKGERCTPCYCGDPIEERDLYVKLPSNFCKFSLICKKFYNVCKNGLYKKFFAGVLRNKMKCIGYQVLALICRKIDKGFTLNVEGLNTVSDVTYKGRTPFSRRTPVYSQCFIAMEGSKQEHFLDYLRENIRGEVDKRSRLGSNRHAISFYDGFKMLLMFPESELFEYLEDRYGEFVYSVFLWMIKIDLSCFGSHPFLEDEFSIKETVASILRKKGFEFVRALLVVDREDLEGSAAIQFLIEVVKDLKILSRKEMRSLLCSRLQEMRAMRECFFSSAHYKVHKPFDIYLQREFKIVEESIKQCEQRAKTRKLVFLQVPLLLLIIAINCFQYQ